MMARLDQIWSAFETKTGRTLPKFDSKHMPEVEEDIEPEAMLPESYVRPSRAAISKMKELLTPEEKGGRRAGPGGRGPERAFQVDVPVQTPRLEDAAGNMARARATYAELAVKRRRLDYVDWISDEARRELEEAGRRRGFFGRLFGRSKK